MKLRKVKFLKSGLAVCILCVLSLLAWADGERDMDYAVEKAAEEAVSKMAAASKVRGVDSIAFIGLAGDRKGYNTTFRAALHNLKSRFKFYTRKEVEWGLLTKEIELAHKRGDIMDAKTLQKFGDFKGVQAYLYGVIREANTDSDGTAVFRATLTLSRIETGEQIWEGNVTGRYRGAIKREEVPDTLMKAVRDAGRQIKEKLAVEQNKLPECNVFVLPVIGKKASAVSDVLISQFVSAGDKNMAIYANPSSVDPLEIRDIAIDLEANSPTYSAKKLSEIMKKLEKMYNVNPNAVSKGKYGSRTNTYLIARVINAKGDENEASLMVDVKLRDFKNNKILWGGTFDGKFEEEQSSNTKLKTFWEENTYLIIGIGGGAVVLIAIILVLVFVFSGFRLMTRAR